MPAGPAHALAYQEAVAPGLAEEGRSYLPIIDVGKAIALFEVGLGLSLVCVGGLVRVDHGVVAEPWEF